MPSSIFATVPETDANMAADFFRSWFGNEKRRYVVITQLTPGLRKTSKHRHVTPVDAADTLTECGLDDLVYENDMQWNLYMGVGLMNKKPQTGRKGGKRDTVAVPGVWVDLDTDKDGFFRDEAHCLEFLRALPPEVWPTIVVATGTGGVHAYWKTDVELSASDAEKLTEMWWAYLQDRAGVQIDKLTNCDRVMKLPGSVRWPKAEGEPPTLVRLIYADESRRVRTYHLQRLSQPVFNEYVATTRVIRQQMDRERVAAASEIREWAEAGGWGAMMAIANMEDSFNETHDWADILLPLGWTLMDTDNEGRRIWARPGLASHALHKSAATDYQGSHVMSLFSDSEHTGLAQLQRAEVPLTKYRVYIHCVWGGNEADFVKSYLNSQKVTA